MGARTTRDLRALFAPRSVAVVGASRDPAKWGHMLARGALEGEHRRSVYLVNRSGGEILGRPAFRSLDELPAAPELVAIAVPADSFEETVDAALEAGARAIVAVSAGLGELGEGGRAREQAVVQRVRAAGARPAPASAFRGSPRSETRLTSRRSTCSTSSPGTQRRASSPYTSRTSATDGPSRGPRRQP